MINIVLAGDKVIGGCKYRVIFKDGSYDLQEKLSYEKRFKTMFTLTEAYYKKASEAFRFECLNMCKSKAILKSIDYFCSRGASDE